MIYASKKVMDSKLINLFVGTQCSAECYFQDIIDDEGNEMTGIIDELGNYVTDQCSFELGNVCLCYGAVYYGVKYDTLGKEIDSWWAMEQNGGFMIQDRANGNYSCTHNSTIDPMTNLYDPAPG